MFYCFGATRVLRCEVTPQFCQAFESLICYVNRYFLMFGGSQVQKPYLAGERLFDLLALTIYFLTEGGSYAWLILPTLSDR